MKVLHCYLFFTIASINFMACRDIPLDDAIIYYGKELKKNSIELKRKKITIAGYRKRKKEIILKILKKYHHIDTQVLFKYLYMDDDEYHFQNILAGELLDSLENSCMIYFNQYKKEQERSKKRLLLFLMVKCKGDQYKIFFINETFDPNYNTRLIAIRALDKKCYKNDRAIIKRLKHLSKTEKRDGIMAAICSTAVTVMNHKDAQYFLFNIKRKVEKGVYGKITSLRLTLLDDKYGFGLYSDLNKK